MMYSACLLRRWPDIDLFILQLMVDGVLGCVDHVVRHVVVEHNVVLEVVIILHLSVKEMTVLV